LAEEAAVPGIREGALALAAVLWHLGHLLSSPGALTIVSAAMLAAVLIGLVAATAADGARIARVAAAAPLTRRASGLREKSWSAAFLRQRDPDAAGRPRPRAPSVAPAAA
jgi:Family of unknown function (DUF6412)